MTESRTTRQDAPRRLRKALLVLAALPMLLMLGEGMLRIGGYGYSTRPFVHRNCEGRSIYIYNKHLFRRFLDGMDPAMWDVTEFDVAADKPEGAYRIFFFGGGQAWGWPDATYGFSRMVEKMLQARFPGVRFEVYNAAFPFQNSHIARTIVDQLGSLQPDLLFCYLGGNEFIGPFGPETFNRYRPRSDSMAWIRANMWLSDWRLVQWSGMLTHRPWIEPGQRAEPMRPDAPEAVTVYDYFAANMDHICRKGTEAGAKVILCIEAGNLRDWPPSESVHRKDLAPELREQWQAVYDRGRTLEEQGQIADALECFRKALEIDNMPAEAHFRAGRCLWALEDYEAARRCFEQAAELDSLTWSRPRVRANEMLADTASRWTGNGVFLLDGAQALADQSPHGIPGCEFFCDRVHMTFEGAYVMACAAFDAIIAALPEAIRSQHGSEITPLSIEECRVRLGATAYALAAPTRMLVDSYQGTGMEAPQAARDRAARLEEELSGLSGPALIRTYREALAAGGPDCSVQLRLVDTLGGAEALDEAETLVQQFPCRRIALRAYARALDRLGRREEAAAAYHRVLELYPDDGASYVQLGALQDAAGDPEGALTCYERACRAEPGFVTAWRCRTALLERIGRVEAAVAAYQQAIAVNMFADELFGDLDRLLREKTGPETRVAAWRRVVRDCPKSPRAHFSLGVALEESGDIDGAMAAFGEAERWAPANPEYRARLDALRKVREGERP